MWTGHCTDVGLISSFTQRNFTAASNPDFFFILYDRENFKSSLCRYLSVLSRQIKKSMTRKLMTDDEGGKNPLPCWPIIFRFIAEEAVTPRESFPDTRPSSRRSAVSLLIDDLSERIRASLSLPPVPRALRLPLPTDAYLAHFDFSGRLRSLNNFR